MADPGRLNPVTPERGLQYRVVIAAPTGCDAEVLCRILHDAGFDTTACQDLQELCRNVEDGAAAGIIAEEFLAGDSTQLLATTLAKQPEWSDFPLIVMAAAGESQHYGWRSLNQIKDGVHAVILQRPVWKLTLLSSVRAAVQSRSRQYQVRDQLIRRQQAEAALRDSEQRFRSMANTTPAMIWTADADGTITWSSDRWFEYTGIARDTNPRDWPQVLHPTDVERCLEQWNQALAKGSEYEIEVRNRRFDGTYRWFVTRATPIHDSQGRLVEWYGSTTDIHDRKEAEESLREADRRKDEFLATLAHELRNPLAPIRSGLELMKMVRDDPDTLEQTRGMMERQTRQLITLVDDLLDVSRITRQKLELRKARVALAEVVQIALEASRPIVEEGGHTLTVQIPDDPIYMHADANRLAQVLSNLLNNAAKYTPRQGNIRLTAELQEGHVLVSVKDTGIGIPADMWDQIFEMFAQINHPQERGYTGLGIGLTLVKSLVQMHEGSIDVFSDGPNQGSTFRVRLPVLYEAAAAQGTTPQIRKSRLMVGKRRVLIVDDNKAAADMLSMVVQMLGNEVRTAADGRQAIKVAAEFLPDVVLMDLGMPTMNGYEAARYIRQQPWGNEMALIALTGWGQTDDKRRTREAGFDHHLVKPADPDELQSLLSQVDRDASDK